MQALFESDYLFGLCGAGGEHLMLDVGRPGWLLCAESVGHDPADRTGVDFTPYSSQGLGLICRITHAPEPDGTLPHSSLYEPFARRVAAFVRNSRGCHIWVIGNEMNYAVARPGIHIDWSRHASVHGPTPEQSDPARHGIPVRFNVFPDPSTEIRTTRGAMVNPGEVITPEMYVRCYRLCRDGIRRLPGHETDQVLVGAVAPWNTQTIYPGNANGDWVQYFGDILGALNPNTCDGFTLHTYTRGQDPNLVVNDERLGPPFQSYHSGFRAYMDFLAAAPEAMRQLPVYITECDPTEPWQDRNTGWIQQAYAEINAWNQQPGNQIIRALLLYQWPKQDRWHLDEKPGVLDDFRQALQNEYRWRAVRQRSQEPAAPVDAAREPDVATPTSVAPVAKGPQYRVRWVEDRFPGKLVIGQVATVHVTVVNDGMAPWPADGDAPVCAGYRYYRNRRLLDLGEEKNLRSPLAEDALPGVLTTIALRVALPDQPGNYTLELDLYQEGVGWFKDQGSPTLTRWLTVEAPPLVPENGDGGGSFLPVPLFSDISGQLPRSRTPYAQRALTQINYIVISHTGADPRLRLDRIAETHIRNGYPGIAYDFVVDAAGQVYKVSGLEEVAQPDQIWSEQGVNVCLVGNFHLQPPSLAQMDAASRLCAWLAQNLGLRTDAIVGLGELAQGRSPGESFYTGPMWKANLSRQVQLHLTALNSHGDNSRALEMRSAFESLRTRHATLEREVQHRQAQSLTLESENLRLREEVYELSRQLVDQSSQIIGGVRAFNWVNRLPRDAARYRPRRTQDVHYIVIHHTGTAADVSLADIAATHRQEWPGILFDYCIDASGEIYQTQPLDEVADTDEEYIRGAVSIAFIGDLDATASTAEQLHAAGLLIASLLERYPQLRMEHIRGASELAEIASPGGQWQTGIGWKEMLLAAVRGARGAGGSAEVEHELRGRVAELEQQIALMDRNSQTLVEQRILLQADNQKLAAQLADRQQDAKAYVVPQPAMRTVVDQLPKHPTLRYERRALNQITHLAVHHTAAPTSMGPGRIAELHVAADPGRGKDPWPGIGYHYFIHADGAIDQTNSLEAASFHVYRHNIYSVGIVFAGSFMNGKIPTSAQMRAGAHLVGWLMQELNIPLARVWGHREFPDNSTVCPGSEWTLGNRWRDLLFERVEQIQAGIGVKNIRHYMIFWQRPYPGPLARQDYVNGISYVVRFRPTVGFSVQDARNAEYVTIVGNEAGVSAAEEKLLRQSGCKVERVAGRDEEETSRLLAELAAAGRRFRTFDVDF